MNNFSRTFLALAGVALMAQSCNQKADENNITVKNGGATGQPSITYVVQVVDAPGNAGGRVAGIPGATIKYVNAAGKSMSLNTDAGGNVIIKDAAPGAFNGRLEKPGYAAMDFTADLNPGANALADSGKSYFGSTRLYAIRSNAFITGRVYGNYTGNAPSPVQPGLGINQRPVNLRVTYGIVKSGSTAYPMGAGTGRLVDVNIDPSTVSITSDADGKFLFENLHATGSGLIDAHLSMSPLTVGSNNTSFVISRENNNISLNLSSNDTLQLGDVLAVKP